MIIMFVNCWMVIQKGVIDTHYRWIESATRPSVSDFQQQLQRKTAEIKVSRERKTRGFRDC